MESNIILPRAYHVIDRLWFIATQSTITFTLVCPQKQKETMIVNPPLGIIKLNMSFPAKSGYLNLLPYYHNESKLNVQDQLIDNIKSYNGSNLQIWKPFISTVPNSTKTEIPVVLKDTKGIPMRNLILIAYKSRKSGKLSVPRWIYLTTIIPTLAILGVGIFDFFRKKKNKCKKRFAKIYRLARNRGNKMETPGYNAVSVCTADKDVYMEEDNSTQHEEDSIVHTDVKQKQDHEVEAKSTFHVLRLTPPVTTQV